MEGADSVGVNQEKIGVFMVKQQDLYQKMMVNNKQKSQPIPNDLSRTGWHKPILTFSKYPNVSAQRLLLILTWWQPIIIHIPSHGSANPKKMVEDQREVRTWEVSHTHTLIASKHAIWGGWSSSIHPNLTESSLSLA